MSSPRPQIVLVSRCFVKRDDGKLLVIQRSKNDKHYPGVWEVPGGKLDKGQDLLHAQEREVMEETGLLAETAYRLASVDGYLIGDGDYAGLPYVVVFNVTRLTGGILKLSHEHDDSAWVTYEEMLGYDLTPEVRKAAITLEKYLA